MLCLCSSVSCASKPDTVLIGAATVQCQVDCVRVSKAFVKEHAEVLDRLIRTEAALMQCQRTP